MHTSRRRRLAALATSVVLAAAISACASGAAVTSYSAQECVEQFAGIVYDYDPAPSPAALSEQSQLVVTGTIDRVQEGRLEIVPENSSAPGRSTTVLVLRDPHAVLGDLGEGGDGFVYIELSAPGLDAHPDGPCIGASVVAYLGAASDGAPAEGVDVAIADPEAGRPAGQPLYILAGPQALVLQCDEETVVWPLIEERREGGLTETLPNGTLIAP